MRRLRPIVVALLAAAASCSESSSLVVTPLPIRDRVQKKFRAFSASLLGAEQVRPGDRVDILLAAWDPQTGEPMTMTLLQHVDVLDALPLAPPTPEGEARRTLALLLLPEEGEILFEAANTGILFATLRNPEDIDIQEERSRATLSTLLTGERINTLLKKRVQSIQVIKGTTERAGGGGYVGGGGGYGGGSYGGGSYGSGAVAAAAPPADRDGVRDTKSAPGAPEPENAGGSPAPTRAWFPESFLFAPLVATDAEGRASLSVPIPDRLTTWHVLALAHSAEGMQAGTVDEFLGTLPAYLDPVVPPFLFAGDEVRLPLEVVNTTDHALSQPMTLEATGAEVSGGSAKVQVAAGESTVTFATLHVTKPGAARLKATLGSTDAVAREIPVKPTGQPYSQRQGGTLAAPREIDLTAPADLDPDTAQVHLLAYPGALALVRSELTAAASRGGVAEDAYALLLAGQAPALFTALGDQPEAAALRTLTLLASQRVIREARSPSVDQAALLAESAAAHPESPILSRLAQRLAEQVARAQRPDGTFQGGAGWTLQRLLVVTADAVRAVSSDHSSEAASQRAASVALKSGSAFERNRARVADAYTAAVILGSGAATGSLADSLREQVRNAVVQAPDGSRRLPVDKGVLRPDGVPPTEIEATARAVLALEGDTQAPWIADLGGTLLAGYSPELGWGDGETNRIALRAVALLFKQKLPAEVKITLAVDGAQVAHGELRGSQLRDVLALDAALPSAAGQHHYTVKADPPLPGLGFSLELQGTTPWKSEPNTGLELEVTAPTQLAVDTPQAIAVAAHGPAGSALRAHLGLPAGVQAVTASLEALVKDHTIESYHLSPGMVDLDLAPLRPGQAFAAHYQVIATLAGTLHAPASSLEAVGREGEAYHLPPSLWTIQ